MTKNDLASLPSIHPHEIILQMVPWAIGWLVTVAVLALVMRTIFKWIKQNQPEQRR